MSEASEGPVQASGPLEVSRPAKPPRKALRGRRGGLKNMPTMPMDVLLEIFSHMHPKDLLNLARTSKVLRGFLMSRHSASLWKKSWKHTDGAPPCPSFMSLPAYTELLFSNHCHNCFRATSAHVTWNFMVRYCTTCRKLAISDKSPKQSHSALVDEILSFAPHDADVFSIFSHYSPYSSHEGTLWHLSQIAEVQTAWSNLKDNCDAKRQYVEKHITRLKLVKEHAPLLYQWDRELAVSRACRRDDIRQHRREAIVRNLRQLGWGEEIDLIKEAWVFRSNKLVDKAKKLNDREWRMIRDDMIALMNERRKYRLLTERKRILHDRLQTFASAVSAFHAKSHRTAATECLPSCADLALLNVVSEIIDVPETVDVTVEDFSAFVQGLPEVIDTWQADIKLHLTNLIAGCVVVGLGCLDLAVAFFQCAFCKRPLRYPDIIAHPCLRKHYFLTEDQSIYVSEAVALCEPGSSDRPGVWTKDSYAHIKFLALQQVQWILQECRKHPSFTTLQDLDALDLRVCCTRSARPQYTIIMTWRNMLGWGNAFPDWREVLDADGEDVTYRIASKDERDTAKIYEASSEDSAIQDYQTQRFWCCALCSNSEGRMISNEEVKEHLVVSHSVESATEGDYFLHPEGKPLTPNWILMFPPDGKRSMTWFRAAEKKLNAEGRVCFWPR